MPRYQTDEHRFSLQLWYDPETDCIDWIAGGSRQVYGNFWLDGRQRPAHRVAYEWMVGPISEGQVVHHHCENVRCVNHEHLEAMPQRGNVMLGVGPTAQKAKQTHCLRGHPFTPENTYVPPGRPRRMCRICMSERQKSA